MYLPIEPHFPADRIATMLSRAGCRLVLTERGSTTTLDQALDSLPGVQTLFIDAAYQEDHADRNLGIAVAPDQLAYIYFTSGSTGEPKGAMCEHAGMLNHLYAKIDDLEIGEGRWWPRPPAVLRHLAVAAGLRAAGRWADPAGRAGGDPGRRAVRRHDRRRPGRRASGRAVLPGGRAVLPGAAPARAAGPACVSVTGEALKKELTQRWFAAQPGIKLVNAYGLTETSDDTNHEVMDRVPDRDRCRSVARSTTCRSTWLTSTWRRCRWAPRA